MTDKRTDKTVQTSAAPAAGVCTVLVGAGGHCRSVIEAAESAGVKVAGVLERPGGETSVLDIPVIGTDDDMARLAPDHEFIITLGNVGLPVHRRRLAAALEAAGCRPAAPLIAAGARVSRHASLGRGTVVLHNAVVNAAAGVGDHCIVNTGAVVEHDAVLGDFVHLSTGAIVNGGARIGSGCMIGSGAIVLQGVSICDDCIIGAGAVVTRPIAVPGTYVGVPARPIHK